MTGSDEAVEHLGASSLLGLGIFDIVGARTEAAWCHVGWTLTPGARSGY